MHTLDDTNDGWLACKRSALAAIELETPAIAMGRVERIADGIAFVSGLPDVALDELVDIESGVTGYVHSLDVDVASVVMLDSSGSVQAGMRVTPRHTVLDVSVGDALLGRVVDPLGRPLDGGEPIRTESRLPIERPAPAIVERDFVSEPLETGVLVVDALFAIGRGQRELIIGDRATGKTSLAIETIVNQRHSDVICIYVAIGQRATAVQRAIDAIRQYGAPERCVFVVASSASPPGLQWIAPFAGFSIAEFFRDRGQHALIVIDDLTKHAATHRELALLTREPPGREAYPGDIFYLHARLLERAARLSADLGGGSLTALPIAETDAGNLSAYIPTNLISITDGQIVLDAGLFAANQRPAVDVGLSVSRVGGKAQYPALRDVAGRLRLDYAQFLELEVFSRFGGLADTRVVAQVERGRRIRALFAQPRFSALRGIDQVALLSALADGLFDGVSVEAIAQVRQRLVASGTAHRLAGDTHDAEALSAPLDDALRQRLIDLVREIVERAKPGSAGDLARQEHADDQPAQ
ncbi:F0F1 ATP synthase subunit alpha [Paraburkholderia sp. Tr-20389]|uniref:F0F1 ATP synthase subunit alpha n=1 Tax=Paraburkholderia sp. Tr-20389 TaxID=2703903 RepID=UPI00197F0989|nr:F0F1 ATP synthase subunit alpha [Paraburkholderia sp. Tr-20389]MBN3752255.1 F0F1 ATP synthase subunit alpha [Paraburkholderia sp. Tr-20389]